MGDGNGGEVSNTLFRLKRGLCGYVSYLAACDMNQAFSEYVLYEPILRILTGQQYQVSCEYPCPGIQQPLRGDKKKLDFYARRFGSPDIAIEAKWVSPRALDVQGDLAKLAACKFAVPSSLAFLLLFGRRSNLEDLGSQLDGCREWGQPVYAEFRTTRYGCRIFRV